MIKTATAPYPVTVRDAYFADLQTDEIIRVGYMRTVGLSIIQNTQKIPGSGRITDQISRITGIDLSVASSRLPAEIVRKYRGKKVSENGGFSAINVKNKFPAFAFGFVVENSDQSFTFAWLPNCTMTENNETYQTTPVDGANDPVQDTTISALPDPESEDLLIDYNQGEVKEGFTPLTEEEFFAKVIKSFEDELIDSETATTPTENNET